jgi:hypothetical protein
VETFRSGHDNLESSSDLARTLETWESGGSLLAMALKIENSMNELQSRDFDSPRDS